MRAVEARRRVRVRVCAYARRRGVAKMRYACRVQQAQRARAPSITVHHRHDRRSRPPHSTSRLLLPQDSVGSSKIRRGRAVRVRMAQ